MISFKANFYFLIPLENNLPEKSKKKIKKWVDKAKAKVEENMRNIVIANAGSSENQSRASRNSASSRYERRLKNKKRINSIGIC